jgi:hypothetical protein
MQEKLPSLVLTTYGMVSGAFFLKQDASHILLQGKCSVYKPRANLIGMLERERQMALRPPPFQTLSKSNRSSTRISACTSNCCDVLLHLHHNYLPAQLIDSHRHHRRLVTTTEGVWNLNKAWGGGSRAMRMLDLATGILTDLRTATAN